MISAATANTFTIDTCEPGSGCTPAATHFTIKTLEPTNIDVGLKPGAFVQIHFATELYNAGQLRTVLGVENVAAWNGKPNPVAPSDHWQFLAVDGQLENPHAPFDVSSEALDCAPLPQSTGWSRLTFAAATGAPLVLEHGESGSLDAAGRTWHVAVVRAFNRAITMPKRHSLGGHRLRRDRAADDGGATSQPRTSRAR